MSCVVFVGESVSAIQACKVLINGLLRVGHCQIEVLLLSLSLDLLVANGQFLSIIVFPLFQQQFLGSPNLNFLRECGRSGTHGRQAVSMHMMSSSRSQFSTALQFGPPSKNTRIRRTFEENT
jgi:hypothetical protein